MALVLTQDERRELEARLRSRKIRAEDARRARVILMLADGASYSMIEATVPCYRDVINRWRRRFVVTGLAGLQAGHYSQPRILEKTRRAPPDGSTHWSTRKLARLLRLNRNHVAHAWQRAGLQPHRFERYMRSDDPDFEPKATDVIGLYVNPPQHAVVLPPTRRRPFKLSIGWTRCCRSRRGAPSDMASSTTGDRAPPRAMHAAKHLERHLHDLLRFGHQHGLEDSLAGRLLGSCEDAAQHH